ncbi:DUF2796 domain-containing protein [Wenzhouxiangella sp. XN79A]|uniref:ZrgA family zinc uptake protein n=1 Tax=Wenzhouxiangella sp. XN79A TaxID=2724193 RepID=UPI00144A6F7C|nr:DUF2796 domain-containing protein [Wenzhouxiangella sp. XN79A]NKI33552.1 DUF2796 domain-containing protein [Wenzhouxiangella sp. XN79A]
MTIENGGSLSTRYAMLTALLLASPALDAQQELRRGDVHQHSVATAQLAIEDGRLDLSLQFPGANLVGFEHPPRDAAQAEALEAATARLAAGDWLVLPADAGCRTTVSVDRPGFAVEASMGDEAGPTSAFDAPSDPHRQDDHDHGDHDHGDHDHGDHDHGEHDHGEHDHGEHSRDDHQHGDHDHDHGHDDADHDHHHDHGDQGHAEFHVVVVADCSNPAALDRLALDLFDDWPDNRSIRVDAITATRQWRHELTEAAPGIDLQ